MRHRWDQQRRDHGAEPREEVKTGARPDRKEPENILARLRILVGQQRVNILPQPNQPGLGKVEASHPSESF